MAGINDYTLDVILKAKAEGLAAFAEVSAGMAAMVAQAELANTALDRMNSRGAEHSRMLQSISNYTRVTAAETANLAARLEGDLTPALNRSSTASNNANNNFYRFLQGLIPGGRTIGNIVLGLSALVNVFPPLLVGLAASLVLFGAWMVGATAFAAVIALAVGGIGLLVAGVTALGLAQMGGIDPAKALETAQKQLATATNQTEAAQEAVAKAQLAYNTAPTAMKLLTLQQAQEQLTESQKKQVDAQNAVNTAQAQANAPVGVLHQKIEDMAAALGQRAIPMVNAMAGALIPLVPQVQAAGESLMNWFGPRLPQILQIADQAFGNMAAGLNRIAVAWGQVIDHVLARSPEFGNVINGAFNRVIDGIVGLMDNLVRLSDWFVNRLPSLGTNANLVFSVLGYAVQGLGIGMAALVDWIISHWPAISGAFNAAWHAFMDGWAVVGPILEIAWKNALSQLAPYFKYIEENAKNLLPYFIFIAAVLGGLIVVVIGVGGALAILATIIVFLATQLTHLIEWAIPNVGAFFSRLGSWIQLAIHDVGGFFSELGDGANRIGQALAAAAAAIGAFFSGLGTGIQAGLAVIGGFFSAVGTAMSFLVGIVGSTFGAIFNIVLTIGAIIFGAWLLLNQAIYNALIPIWNAVAAFIQSVLTAIWGVIVQIWTAVLAFLTAVWTTIWGVAVERWTAITTNIATALTLLWTGYIQPIWNAVLAFLITIWTAISAFANAIWTAITGIITSWLNQQQTSTVNIWGQIQNFLAGAWNTINGLANTWWSAIWGTITSWAGSIATAVEGVWNGMVTTAATIMGRLGKAVKDALNSVIDIFDIFINATNATLDPIMGKSGKGADVAIQVIPHFAKGGVLDGYAPGQDTVLALLSPGEGVLTPQAVRGIGGPSTIEKINKEAQRFATGGVVSGASISAWLPNAGPMTQGPGGSFSHQGLNAWDFSVPMGSNLYAGVSGTVQPGSMAGGYGNYIQFLMDQGGVVILGHLLRALISGHVGAGTLIGLTDNTGNSTGPHLHFEVRGSALTPGGGGVGLPNPFPGLVDAAVNAAKGLVGNLPAWIQGLPGPVLDMFAASVKDKFSSLFASLTSPAAALPGQPGAPGSVGAWISQSLALSGHPQSWASYMAWLVQHESSGNPQAVNTIGVAGQHATGIAQTLPSTFLANMVPGHGDIWNPVDNLAAAENYIARRYGSPANIPGIMGGGVWPGYDRGGQLPPGLSYVYNGTGRAENVSSGDTMDKVIAVLQSIDTRLAMLSGQPRLSGQLATQRNG